jgi:nucleotide-binding universal stress UspA family protein
MTGSPIAVGIDGSRSALDAVRWAARDARGRGRALRLVHACVLGSTSRHLLHHSPCPAAVVRAEEAGR